MKLLLYLVILLTINNFAISWRPFKLYMTEGNCYTNSSIISYINCSVSEDTNNGSFNLNILFSEKVFKPTLDVLIALRRQAQTDFVLVDVKDIDACQFFENRNLLQIIKLIRDEISIYSENFPKECPIKKDSVINIKNLVFKADNLPSYMPECNFSVKIKLWSLKEKLMDLTILGTVENKIKIRPKTPKRLVYNKEKI